jgi:glutamate synthase domain-containing protein 2
MTAPDSPKHLQLEESAGFDRRVIDYIQHAAASGLYEIRGLGAKRHLPSFDDLVFLGASLSRYPLEGYREKCSTRTVLGTRFATKPIELATPSTIAGMSFGALSGPAKEALGRGASQMGTSTTTGDGGMTQEERGHSIARCVRAAAPRRRHPFGRLAVSLRGSGLRRMAGRLKASVGEND